MQKQTKIDALARILRDIVSTESTDPRLEAQIGDDEVYEEWGRSVGAMRLLGKLTPWGAQAIEVIVKYSGTYRPHPAMDPIPGIPAHYLCNGGPGGTYSHLSDKKPGQALWKKVDRLVRKLNKERISGVRFYVKTVNKTATGFRGVQTAAWSMTTARGMEPPAPTGPVLRLGRIRN